MYGRTANSSEALWLNAVHQTPCLACSLFHDEHESVSEVHHISGKTKKDAHKRSFALCAWHHRIKDNKKPQRWVSRHGDGRRRFENEYMSESGFLKAQERAYKRLKRNSVGGGNDA